MRVKLYLSLSNIIIIFIAIKLTKLLSIAYDKRRTKEFWYKQQSTIIIKKQLAKVIWIASALLSCVKLMKTIQK